jgi:hypothetical protein
MASSHIPIQPPTTTFIKMMEVGGEWYVRVVEDGQETVQIYPRMAPAMVFASRERDRLNLERFDILY